MAAIRGRSESQEIGLRSGPLMNGNEATGPHGRSRQTLLVLSSATFSASEARSSRESIPDS